VALTLVSAASRLISTFFCVAALGSWTLVDRDVDTSRYRSLKAAARGKSNMERRRPDRSAGGQVLPKMLAGIQQVPFDREAALESARIRIDLEARGLLIGPIDRLIAGTVVSRGAVLVTRNTKEFSRIKGLRLSDWTK
jgi:predicted nucleic acid-binding protein